MVVLVGVGVATPLRTTVVEGLVVVVVVAEEIGAVAVGFAAARATVVGAVVIV
jgi:hypothetical protein